MLKAFAAFVLVFSTLALADSKTYTIKGMHCEDCAKSIKEKLCVLPGLETCKVEIGQVTLVSKNPIDDAQVSKAVRSAGKYSVAAPKATDSVPNTKEAPNSK